jgi:hypothetical protein
MIPYSSMVIDNLDVFGAVNSSRPFEADAALLIDPNAVLAFPVAGQDLQPVAAQLGKVP